MQFRLLLDRETGAADGAANMAVDEALLESAVLPDAMPALRLYHFATPTITFGYGQDVANALNEAACHEHDIDCIRRITGGRALLHQHELTYSVTAPRLLKSVRATYQWVTGAVRAGLERLGVPLDPPGKLDATAAPRHLPCLSVPTGHEITIDGKKLVAGAMRFRRRGFLVHGSILWSVDRRLWKQVTRLKDDDPMPAVGLDELGRIRLGEDELEEALSSAFAELLGGAALRSVLTPAETERASELTRKYRSRGWTLGRRERLTPIG